MKLSNRTKVVSETYVANLKAQIKADIGVEMSNKNLSPIKQKYQHVLHQIEREQRLSAVKAEALELGYILVKMKE